ncbi:MAG: HEPN domain-containing protein [Planctomycetes bacterium]|nr:HEPN domain-containing protein [Planctomycetota bacterium]
MRTQEIAAHLDAAAEALGDAEALLARGSLRSASSRAYYTMFYCASALLLTKGMSFSRHGNVVAAFGREFAKTNLLDRKFHFYILQGFDTRHLSDYLVTRRVTKETAEITVQRAREFLEATRAYLASNPQAPSDPATSR